VIRWRPGSATRGPGGGADASHQCLRTFHRFAQSAHGRPWQLGLRHPDWLSRDAVPDVLGDQSSLHQRFQMGRCISKVGAVLRLPNSRRAESRLSAAHGRRELAASWRDHRSALYVTGVRVDEPVQLRRCSSSPTSRAPAVCDSEEDAITATRMQLEEKKTQLDASFRRASGLVSVYARRNQIE
jgi:hypothetical protein